MISIFGKIKGNYNSRINSDNLQKYLKETKEEREWQRLKGIQAHNGSFGHESSYPEFPEEMPRNHEPTINTDFNYIIC